MKLLLDEMWAPTIAAELRRRGHDVVAVAERPDLRTKPDEEIFAVAQIEGRAIVTEDVSDYRSISSTALEEGRSHAGMIFTLNRTFPRDNPRTTGRLVVALLDLLSEGPELTNLERWLS